MENLTFNGLTSALRGNLYQRSEIRKLAHSFPKSNGAAGSVPSEWLENIPLENRKNFIKELYKIFTEIVKIQEVRKIFTNRKRSKLLKNFLVNNGVIGKNEKLKFSYCGQGSFAEVVKFNVGKKKYALKIFFRGNVVENLHPGFGNCAEQNNALYLGATENSDWTKFYFGNVLDGYMITKYIDNNADLPKKKIKLSEKGLEYIDYNTKNVKLNYNLDYGGFEKTFGFPHGNKVAMWIIKKLKNLPPEKHAKEIEKIVSDKKVPNYNDRIIGIDYVKKYILPKEKELQSQKEGFWQSLARAFLGQYTD